MQTKDMMIVIMIERQRVVSQTLEVTKITKKLLRNNIFQSTQNTLAF